MKKILVTILLASLLISVRVMAAGTISHFSDVPEDSWYTEAVYNLYNAGIIQGYDDGTFKPTNNVNRAELAVILDRFYDLVGDSVEWNTYINSRSNYSVKYPVNWEAAPFSGLDGVQLFPVTTNSGFSEIGPNISIIFLENSSPNILDDLQNKKEIEINGITATQGTIIGGMAESRVTYIPYNSDYIKISWAEDFDSETHHQILASFEFIE